MLHIMAKPDADHRLNEIARLVERADIEVVRRKRDSQLSGVRWATEQHSQVSAHPNVTSLLRGLLPRKPAAYRVGSGAVHSQPWVLDDVEAFDPATRRLGWRFDPAALAGSVDLGIAASVLVLDAFAAMLGQDLGQEREEARRRERAVFRLVPALLKRQSGA